MVDNERFLSSFGALPDEQWLAALLRSTEERIVDGVMFPSFPDAALQFRFVGASGEEALRKAFVFYTEIKRYATMLRIPIDRNTRVLDFGCGWGRFYRFFLKDVAVANLLGVDVDQECIDLCRSTIPMGRFEKCDVRPSLASAAKASFDLIYAYSVLSHLSEETALAWTKEFARVLRPCGMLIVTTLKQAHIDVWDRKMQSGGVHWQAALETAGFSGPKFRSTSRPESSSIAASAEVVSAPRIITARRSSRLVTYCAPGRQNSNSTIMSRMISGDRKQSSLPSEWPKRRSACSGNQAGSRSSLCFRLHKK